MSSKKPKFKQHASNYNYKGKRSFGQKLKNFFTIPEEDLKEEPSKEFEKIKLFTLTRGSLFLGILVFMILINLLVGFNINFLYLRQIFGFLFLIIIPGLLIMLCFKIRTVKFWEYLVYTVGLSIAFIMFAGLAVNWTLPALNITDKPLSLWPILICFDIFLLGLWLTAIYRNKDLKPFDITIPKLDTLNRIFFIIPIIFPLLSILGAFLLNNHGPNILTMIMLGGIAVYVLLLVIFRKHMNENIWPWALYCIGLALLLSGWMRSWFLLGDDNSTEFFIFSLTNSFNHWSINDLSTSYNSMLSLNILPNILNIFFLNIKNYLIFKLLFQIIISFIGVILFIYFSKLFKRIISFLSVFFFLSIPMIYSGVSLGIRQEFAFLFLALMLLSLFTSNLNNYIKKILFVIFGICMIVSHYATAYISLAIFLLTYIFILIYKIKENKNIKKGNIHESEKIDFYLTGLLILILLTFTFLWYTQITPTGEGVAGFLRSSITNMRDIFNEDLQLGNKGLVGNFLTIKKGSSSSYQILNEYVNITYPKINNEILSAPKINPVSHYGSVDIDNIDSFMRSLKLYVEFIWRIVFFFGLFILINLKINFKNVKHEKDTFLLYKIFCICTFLGASLFFILPFFSITYDLARFYHQIVLISAPLLILGFIFILNFLRIKKYAYLIIASLLIFYFLNVSGFFLPLTKSPDSSIRFANYGGEYNLFYPFNSEIKGFEFLMYNDDSTSRIDTDTRTNSKSNLVFNYKYQRDRIRRAILPYEIRDKDFIFVSYKNKFINFATISYKGNWLSTPFPKEFLEDNKNKIYNSGGSEIFK